MIEQSIVRAAQDIVGQLMDARNVAPGGKLYIKDGLLYAEIPAPLFMVSPEFERYVYERIRAALIAPSYNSLQPQNNEETTNV